MIEIYHLKNDLTKDQRRSVTEVLLYGAQGESGTENAKKLWNSGGYEKVATSDKQTLEIAYMLTQNGVMSDSWFLAPPDGITPCEPFYDDNGNQHGRKSSEIGDIFVMDGKKYICDVMGFTKLDW